MNTMFSKIVRNIAIASGAAVIAVSAVLVVLPIAQNTFAPAEAHAAWSSNDGFGGTGYDGNCCDTDTTNTSSSGGWSSNDGFGGTGYDGNCCDTPTYTPPTYNPPTYTYNPPAPVIPSCTLSANKTSVTKGGDVKLTWTSSKAKSATLSTFGTVSTYGSKTVTPDNTITYTLTVKSKDGHTATCSKTITVTLPAPTCVLNVDRTTINRGENVTLSWSTNNAQSVSLTSFGSVDKNGSKSTNPQDNTTYTLTVTGKNGQTVDCTKAITVHIPPTNPGPTCTIIINNYNNQYSNPNQAVNISWNSQNAHTGWINNNVGPITLSGSKTVYPTQTTTYTATFTGHNGQTINCSVTVNINTYVPPTTPYITLSSVPYTGLELGPVGTALYWSFLVFWALFAAYLIVVKRVQNRIYASTKSLLFGTESEVAAAHAHVAHEDVVSRGLFSTADLEVIANTLRSVIEGPSKESHVAPTAPAAPQGDVIDEFVLSQISRPRR